MFSISSKGDFGKTFAFLERLQYGIDSNILRKYGEMGVDALRQATPVDAGLTANSWSYEIVKTNNNIKLVFNNSNIQDGWAPIAILLQYGHGTGTGGYVQGRDYINPAIQPIFDKLAQDAWKELID